MCAGACGGSDPLRAGVAGDCELPIIEPGIL